MMEKYRFGRFVISGGLAMCAINFLLTFDQSIQRRFGDTGFIVSIYSVMFVSMLGLIAFNRNFSSNAVVISGLIGWLVTFALLYIKLSHQ
jgi:hypothetical protein